MKDKKSFTPQHLRSVLSTFLVLLLLGGSALFYLGLSELRDYSATVNQRLADADASGNQVDELQRLRNQLANSSTLVKKADQLFAAPGSYQSRALSDVRAYANTAGLTINKTSFGDEDSHTILVQLNSPVVYTSLIRFLGNIEGNLPKLQVKSLSVSRADGDATRMVDVGQIEIEVSVK